MLEKKFYQVPELLASNGGPIPMSKAGVYLLMARGDIPCVQIGRRKLIPSWWVERLAAEPAELQQPITSLNQGQKDGVLKTSGTRILGGEYV